tara:strand:+ start:4839 stop:5009 length:171 start_codon:yes stop_codon:yes gene_type:complete
MISLAIVGDFPLIHNVPCAASLARSGSLGYPLRHAVEIVLAALVMCFYHWATTAFQ